MEVGFCAHQDDAPSGYPRRPKRAIRQSPCLPSRPPHASLFPRRLHCPSWIRQHQRHQRCRSPPWPTLTTTSTKPGFHPCPTAVHHTTTTGGKHPCRLTAPPTTHHHRWTSDLPCHTSTAESHQDPSIPNPNPNPKPQQTGFKVDHWTWRRKSLAPWRRARR